MMPNSPHFPVLLNEVITALAPKDGGRYVDGTFGNGGYTRAILDAADCAVLAVDQDPDAIKTAEKMAQEYNGDRFHVKHGRFADMLSHATSIGWEAVDGIALDVGVSSMQLDQAERGFSFRHEGPLDMRMAQEGPSAADLVNEGDEGLIADVLYRYGEERQSRRIARAIIRERETAPIETTHKLAAIIAEALGPKAVAKMKIDPATRSFQAIRIYVNDEAGQLAQALLGAEKLLKPGGVLAVVSFHSLEDRMVKRFLTACAKPNAGQSRHLPMNAAVAPSFDVPRGQPVLPGDEELKINPRSRSAKLRYGVRLDAPMLEPRDAMMNLLPDLGSATTGVRPSDRPGDRKRGMQ
ncbi:MAG: 16S rRNA (cytosine(1402)-N(4))-methyltransferase RsmH [Alphaproteobacteria bacterium]